MSIILENKSIYSYDDLYIIPNVTTSISNYNEIDIYNKNGKLPIFTAPIDSIIDEQNFELFNETKLNIIIPDNLSINFRLNKMKEGHWVSLSITEFKKYILNDNLIIDDYVDSYKILINSYVGNSDEFINIAAKAKEKYKNKLKLMMGKVSNPETYEVLSDIGIDYVRCSIGCEKLCGQDNVIINYPIGTLIEDVKKLKNKRLINNKFAAKIVVDGCIKHPKDIVKALALGADYVMAGKIFSASIESAAHICEGIDYIDRKLDENNYIINQIINSNPNINLKHKIIVIGNYGKTNICNLKNEKLQKEIGLEIINIDKNKFDNTQYYYIIDTNKLNMSEDFKHRIINKYKFKKIYHCIQPCNIKNLLDNCTINKKDVIIDVEYTINDIILTIENNLKYCMLRCDSRNLQEFIGNQTLIFNKNI